MRTIRYIVLVLLFPALTNAETGLTTALKQDSIDPIAELYRIVNFYKDVDVGIGSQPENRTFAFEFKETNKDSIAETSTDSYVSMSVYHEKLRMYSLADQKLTIQDSLYCLEIHDNDSIVYVFKPRPVFKHLLLLDLLDRSLATDQILDITLSDSVDLYTAQQYRVLFVRFKPQSRYISYQVTYVKADYSLSNVQYFERMEPVAANTSWCMPPTWNKYELQKIATYINPAPIDHSLFSTHGIFQRTKGKLEPLPPYTGYRIINNSSY